MYISAAEIQELERRYGVPREVEFQIAYRKEEFEFLKASQKHGRAHDVTLLIFRGDEIAVTAKPHYPPGLYRPPSGGVQPGEPFEAGARREAREETGLEIALERYLVRARTRFTHAGEVVRWTTHVFTARYVSGELTVHDSREISGVRWMRLEELEALQPALRATGSSGLGYRAALNEAIFEELRRLGTVETRNSKSETRGS